MLKYSVIRTKHKIKNDLLFNFIDSKTFLCNLVKQRNRSLPGLNNCLCVIFTYKNVNIFYINKTSYSAKGSNK